MKRVNKSSAVAYIGMENSQSSQFRNCSEFHLAIEKTIIIR